MIETSAEIEVSPTLETELPPPPSPPPLPISEKNAHKNDSRIRFRDVDHKYWIDDDDTDIISCTTYIHSFFDDFNSDMIINSIVKSIKWKVDKSYKYYQMTRDQIKNSWALNSKEASEKGTRMHAMIENFYNDLEISYIEEEMPEMDQFLEFYANHENLQIYRTEWMVFAEDLRLTGSIDAVFKNEDGTLTIGDWKRSKQISKKSFSGNKRGKPPFKHLPDCNFTHYSLQLNLYRIILEKYYDFKVSSMFLGVFHPENKDKKYIKIDIPIMESEAESLLQYRRDFLASPPSAISAPSSPTESPPPSPPRKRLLKV